MKTNTPESPLDLNPQPQIIRINRFAFLIACSVIAIIIAVLAYSVGRAGKTNIPKENSIAQTNVSEEVDKQPWYSNISNKLPTADNQTDNFKIIGERDSLDDRDTSKIYEEALHSALESPIKASNISNSVFTASTPSPSGSSNESGDYLYNGQSDSNLQGEKKAFMQQLLQQSNPDYLHQSVKKPLSAYEVKAGTIIPAVLVSGINSDLPGQIIALVSKNIYDSITGRYLLIPQGTKLILQYDSRVAYGQQRLLVGTKRLIFPNGNSLDLEGMPAADSGGYAGLYDEVDNHYLRIFGSSAMMGLITGGFELSQSSQGNDAANPSTSQVMAGSLGQQMGQITLGMMNKNLDIQPTLKIHPGYEFSVTVTSDLVFPGRYQN